MAVVLEARGLNKSFGAVSAAADINVAVERDSVVGLIGSNGAGKTTFINLVTGYLKPSSGSIVFGSRDITRLAPRQITRLGICRSFQIPQLFNTLSVYENLLVGIGIVGSGGRKWADANRLAWGGDVDGRSGTDAAARPRERASREVLRKWGPLIGGAAVVQEGPTAFASLR